MDEFDLIGYIGTPLFIDTFARLGMFPTNITYSAKSNKTIFNWDNPGSLLFNKDMQKKYCEWVEALSEQFKSLPNIDKSKLNDSDFVVDLIAKEQKSLLKKKGNKKKQRKQKKI